MNRILTFGEVPRRIVSTVPSQTELLYSLGLDEEVVAITKFCRHPEHWFRLKQRIGGTKKLDVEKIIRLNPDLVIANVEENTREQINALSERFPVWISDIKTLSDAITMIREVGVLVDKAQQSETLVQDIRDAFNRYQHQEAVLQRALYLIWKEPYMAAGGDTFISDMMMKAGYENAVSFKNRYPEITIDEIRQINPEVILLSSEPFPFNEKHKNELSAATGIQKIFCVDGELFSWYGSRLVMASSYFAGLRKKTVN